MCHLIDNLSAMDPDNGDSLFSSIRIPSLLPCANSLECIRPQERAPTCFQPSLIENDEWVDMIEDDDWAGVLQDGGVVLHNIMTSHSGLVEKVIDDLIEEDKGGSTCEEGKMSPAPEGNKPSLAPERSKPPQVPEGNKLPQPTEGKKPPQPSKDDTPPQLPDDRKSHQAPEVDKLIGIAEDKFLGKLVAFAKFVDLRPVKLYVWSIVILAFHSFAFKCSHD